MRIYERVNESNLVESDDLRNKDVVDLAIWKTYDPRKIDDIHFVGRVPSRGKYAGQYIVGYWSPYPHYVGLQKNHGVVDSLSSVEDLKDIISKAIEDNSWDKYGVSIDDFKINKEGIKKLRDKYSLINNVR